MNEELAEQLLTEREEEITRLREALQRIVNVADGAEKTKNDSTFRAWAASYAECVLEGKATK